VYLEAEKYFTAEQNEIMGQIRKLANKLEDLGQNNVSHPIIAIIQELSSLGISTSYLYEKVHLLELVAKRKNYEKQISH